MFWNKKVTGQMFIGMMYCNKMMINNNDEFREHITQLEDR